MRILFLLVAGLGLAAFGAQEPVKEPASQDAAKNGSKEDLSELAIADIIISRLYPQLIVDPVSDLEALVLKGKSDDVDRARGLIKKIKDLDAEESWALIELNGEVDLQRYRESLPELSVHAGRAPNVLLVYGNDGDVLQAQVRARGAGGSSLRVAAEEEPQLVETEWVFKNISAVTAFNAVVAKFPDVFTRELGPKTLFVRCSASQKQLIALFLHQLDSPAGVSNAALANPGKLPLIIKLRNIQAEEAARQVKGLYPGIMGAGDPLTNTLLIVPDGHDEQGIREIVNAMDVKKDPQWTVFYLRHLSATEAALLLQQLGAKAKIVPNPAQNALMASGTEGEVEAIEEWLNVIDKKMPVGTRNNPTSRSLPKSLYKDFVRLSGSVDRASQMGDPAELRRAVQAEFQARQEFQLAQIQALKQKLEMLEQRVRTYSRLKEQMIARRVNVLLADPLLSLRDAPAVTPIPGAKPRKPGELHKVQPGDTLGVFIEHILGAEGSTPPIHTDPTGVRPPALGFPIAVRGDGTVSLPLISAVKVAGLSLEGVRARLTHAYTVENEILQKGQASVIVTLIREAGSVVAVPPKAPNPLNAVSGSATVTAISDKVQPGDTLGLIIEQILGGDDEPLPVHVDPTGVRPPVMGYPVQVRADGTISLPLLGKTKVAGLTLGQLEEQLRDEFVAGEILRKEHAVVMASIIRKASTVVPAPDENVVRSNVGAEGWSSSAFGDSGQQIAEPGGVLNNVRIFRTASEFAEKLDELGSSGNVSDKRRYDIMLKEFAIQLDFIEGALRVATSTRDSAREELAFTERMHKRGYTANNELVAKQAEVTKSEAQVESLRKLLELYKSVKPETKDRSGSTVKPKVDAPDAKSPKVSFNYKSAPWSMVLKDVAEGCKLKLDVHDEPSGTFTYESRKQCSPDEAVDILTRQLLKQGLVAVKKGGHLIVWSFDNGTPPSLVTEALPEDLTGRYAGLDNLLLTVTFKIDGDVEQLAREIDVLLDPYPFARIAALTSSGRLIVTDLSGNLRRVKKLVDAHAKRKQDAAPKAESTDKSDE